LLIGPGQIAGFQQCIGQHLARGMQIGLQRQRVAQFDQRARCVTFGKQGLGRGEMTGGLFFGALTGGKQQNQSEGRGEPGKQS
jgi:hypothetical protein